MLFMTVIWFFFSAHILRIRIMKTSYLLKAKLWITDLLSTHVTIVTLPRSSKDAPGKINLYALLAKSRWFNTLHSDWYYKVVEGSRQGVNRSKTEYRDVEMAECWRKGAKMDLIE